MRKKGRKEERKKDREKERKRESVCNTNVIRTPTKSKFELKK